MVRRSRSCASDGLVVEVLDQPPLPRRREIERCDQRGEQADVADADVGCGKAVKRRSLRARARAFRRPPPPRRRGRRIRCRPAGIRRAHRCDGGRPGRDSRSSAALPARGRGQIVARDRDREVGPQAEFAALRVGGEIHALADVLAGEIEERLRRLQDRGLHARIAGALVGGDERPRPQVGRVLSWWCGSVGHVTISPQPRRSSMDL